MLAAVATSPFSTLPRPAGLALTMARNTSLGIVARSRPPQHRRRDGAADLLTSFCHLPRRRAARRAEEMPRFVLQFATAKLASTASNMRAPTVCARRVRRKVRRPRLHRRSASSPCRGRRQRRGRCQASAHCSSSRQASRKAARDASGLRSGNVILPATFATLR